MYPPYGYEHNYKYKKCCVGFYKNYGKSISYVSLFLDKVFLFVQA